MLWRLLCAITFLALWVTRANAHPNVHTYGHAYANASAQATPSSPAITALSNALARGDRSAEAQFWQRMHANHTPLVEMLPQRTDSACVTFVWRGDSATRNVLLVAPMALQDIGNGVMSRLPGSDVWYRSYVMPMTARMAYRFAVNDNLVPFHQERAFMARMATWQRDPDNPASFDMGMRTIASLFELSGAPSRAWATDDRTVPHGRVQEVVDSSRVLGSQRRMWVYSPPGVTSPDGLDLLLLHDGESYQLLMHASTIFDNLIHARRVRPFVAVLLDNPGATREADLNCNVQWSRHLATEVVPWARSRYRAGMTREHVIIGGYSLGGLAAACAAVHQPTAFGSVLAQSGSFYRAPDGEAPEWLARTLSTTARLPIRFYLNIGQLETGALPSSDPSMLTSSRHLRDVLVARGYDVHFQELYSGHEHVAWQGALPQALMALLPPK